MLTSLSMEVLRSSSLPSCSWTELMLKTILLWFWPSEEAPRRVHLCFPDRVKSHMTSSPLRTHTASATFANCVISSRVCELICLMLTDAPEAAGHKLSGTTPRPVDTEPQSLLDPRINGRASFLQIWQLKSHHTYKEGDGSIKTCCLKKKGFLKLTTAINMVTESDLFPLLCSRSSWSGLCSPRRGSSPSPRLQTLHSLLQDVRTSTKQKTL